MKVMKEGRKGEDADKRELDRMRGREAKRIQSSVVIDVGSDQMGFLLHCRDIAFA